MSKAVFISEDYIKQNTNINDNVDVKLLKMAIIEAQELHLLEAIGTALYNDLNTKIIADPDLSGYPNELALMRLYVRPMLKYWVLYEATPVLLFKLTNKANSTSTSDNSNPIQYEDMKYSQNQYKAKAQVYTERLIKYLQANYTTFPLYYNAGTSIDTIFPKNEGFTTDWYLGLSYSNGQTNDTGDIR